MVPNHQSLWICHFRPSSSQDHPRTNSNSFSRTIGLGVVWIIIIPIKRRSCDCFLCVNSRKGSIPSQESRSSVKDQAVVRANLLSSYSLNTKSESSAPVFLLWFDNSAHRTHTSATLLLPWFMTRLPTQVRSWACDSLIKVVQAQEVIKEI